MKRLDTGTAEVVVGCWGRRRGGCRVKESEPCVDAEEMWWAISQYLSISRLSASTTSARIASLTHLLANLHTRRALDHEGRELIISQRTRGPRRRINANLFNRHNRLVVSQFIHSSLALPSAARTGAGRRATLAKTTRTVVVKSWNIRILGGLK